MSERQKECIIQSKTDKQYLKVVLLKALRDAHPSVHLLHVFLLKNRSLRIIGWGFLLLPLITFLLSSPTADADGWGAAAFKEKPCHRTTLELCLTSVISAYGPWLILDIAASSDNTIFPLCSFSSPHEYLPLETLWDTHHQSLCPASPACSTGATHPPIISWNRCEDNFGLCRSSLVSPVTLHRVFTHLLDSQSVSSQHWNPPTSSCTWNKELRLRAITCNMISHERWLLTSFSADAGAFHMLNL